MSPKFWDLTPSDTNLIEGSHAHDNQVNKTNATLLEAILRSSQQVTNFMSLTLDVIVHGSSMARMPELSKHPSNLGYGRMGIIPSMPDSLPKLLAMRGHDRRRRR
jgi:hypothetical protein